MLNWLPAPPNLTLPPDEAHVWRARLDVMAESFRESLQPDERERAERFYFAEHRRRFIARRRILRYILGRYLGQDPAELRFEYGPRGKPALSGRPLYFNLSHSEEMALFAVTRHREVGVDIEHIQPRINPAEIAKHSFSAAEKAELNSLPPDQQLIAFFNGWTRKEAYIKARGEGLALPLPEFDVSLGHPAALLATRDDPQEAARWTMIALDPGPGYAAALVVEGDGWRLRCWQFQEGGP